MMTTGLKRMGKIVARSAISTEMGVGKGYETVWVDFNDFREGASDC
jgi:hypothetical protein